MVRFPFGILASIIVTLFFLLMTPLEFVAFICWMPFAAVLASREDFRANAWVRGFPYFFREIGRRNHLIWKWVGND